MAQIRRVIEIFLLEDARNFGIRDKSLDVKKSKRKEWQANNRVNIPVG